MAGHLTGKGRIADHDEMTAALIVSHTFFAMQAAKVTLTLQKGVEIIVAIQCLIFRW